MDGAGLMLADFIFMAVLILILVTGGLNTNAIILVPMLIVTFASCVIRHINHYNDTGRFY